MPAQSLTVPVSQPFGGGTGKFINPNSPMDKSIRISMPDGSEWDVPAGVVAHNRAVYYANLDTGNKSGADHTEKYQSELRYTLENHEELIDWAENNMNWSDVQHCATMHKSGSVDYDYGWINGTKTIIVPETTIE